MGLVSGEGEGEGVGLGPGTGLPRAGAAAPKICAGEGWLAYDAGLLLGGGELLGAGAVIGAGDGAGEGDSAGEGAGEALDTKAVGGVMPWLGLRVHPAALVARALATHELIALATAVLTARLVEVDRAEPPVEDAEAVAVAMADAVAICKLSAWQLAAATEFPEIACAKPCVSA